jgi:hypothetical protein
MCPAEIVSYCHAAKAMVLRKGFEKMKTPNANRNEWKEAYAFSLISALFGSEKRIEWVWAKSKK